MLKVEKGGWASYEGERGTYLLRFEDRAGYLSVAEVHVKDAESVSEALRDLPLRMLEAVANSQDALRRALDEATEVEAATDEWLAALASRRSVVIGTEGPRSLRIKGAKVAPGQKRPDDFYQAVLQIHALATSQGKTAEDIARANGVPVTSVYRWLKEARARVVMAAATGRARGRSKAKPGTVIRKGERGSE